MFEFSLDDRDVGVHHYTITKQGAPITYRQALDLFISDEAFAAFLSRTMARSSFEAFRWETPAISIELIDRQFEFVIVDAPELCVPADSRTFAEQFARDAAGAGIVAFENLGRDATLLVPTPISESEHYSHLAAFVRGAPKNNRLLSGEH